MVGLSVILENYRDLSEKRSPQVISKGNSIMIKPPYSPTTPSKTASFRSPNGFLEYCFLCKQKLLPGKDIYMYNGDKAFCSEDCRCRQIFMDEEETTSLAAKSGCTREYNSSLPSSSRSSGKGARNRANAFAY